MRREIISTHEASEILGVGTTTVKRWADEGKLSSMRTMGGHRRFRLKDVQALLQLEQAQAESDPSHSPHDEADIWVERLLAESNGYSLQAALLQERSRRASWAAMADAIASVVLRLGKYWETGRISVVEEHLASDRLSRALAAVAAQIPVPSQAPRCGLVMAVSDPHTLGLSMAEIAARDAGWTCEWIGAKTPTKRLLKWLETRPVEGIALSASVWSSDRDGLNMQYRQIAKTCQELGILVILGGEGAWPEQIPYGHRLHFFQHFADLLREQVDKENHHVAS